MRRVGGGERVTSTRRLITQNIVIIFAATMLTACHITLITDYDETFDQEATQAQKDVDALLQKIINNPNKQQPAMTADAYAMDKDAYAKIDNELQALLVRARAHQNNSGTIDSVQKVIHSFSLIENEHKTKPSLRIAQVEEQKTIMNDEFTALIAEEILKKQGK
jgi:hypothetical protein